MEESEETKKKKQEVSVEQENPANEDLKTMSLDDLNILLNTVLEHEDYIRAIAIRDEINNRRKR